MRIKLKLKRMQEGLTQKELGDLVEYTGQYISYVERGALDGGKKFWDRLKKLWNISDEELDSYKMQNEEII